PPPLFRQVIRRVRELTARPFGVNLVLHFPVEDHVAVCLEERVPVLSFFWGDPTPYVGRAHAAGIKAFHQVGSVAAAQGAGAVGVDVIIAQGAEAGGHVAGSLRPGPGPPGRGYGRPAARGRARHGGKLIVEATVKLDPTKKPRRMDLTFTAGPN